MKLLIVEDEQRLNETVSKYMTAEGYTVDSCFDGEEALLYIDGTEYDAIVLDIMMPKVDGLEVLRTLRARKDTTPVLLLTAKSEVEDKIIGLDAGADDYMAKPFSLEELAARIRVMIRRGSPDQTSHVLTAGNLKLDTKTKIATQGKKEIKLTAKEYAILEYLLYNRGQVLSREKIEQHIWNYDYEGSSNIVDVYIRTLRKKLNADTIETVRGLGYVIR